MPRILYVTTDLPYFPGQGGLMPLQIRHLAQTQFIGVVGPRYPHQPEDALQRMRDTVQRSYWWPEHPVPGDIPAVSDPGQCSVRWIRFLPRSVKYWLLRRLSGLSHHPDDALAWRIVITNLAPKLLEALGAERWNVVLLAQSNTAAWFPFLPASLARCLYFHDIRADYLQRAPVPPSQSELRRILRNERLATQQVDAMAVVSTEDLARATRLLSPPCPVAVVPICIDLEYFSFQPPAEEAEPIVLFTGHLSHPPNVDAAIYFLSAIWPLVLAAVPSARFKIVGLQPAPAIAAAVAQAPNAELIPNVGDIRPSFRTARVYVAPLRYGGGVRQKILEAWALGLPVVSTRLGADGLAASDGVNCWLRDDPSEFAAAIITLLRAPVPVQVLQAARAKVVEQHAPPVSCPKLAAQIAISTERRRRSPVRILYDLRWLQPGKVGGVEQMTHELVDELSTFDRAFEYRILGTRQVCRRWQFPAEFCYKAIPTDGLRERWRARRNAAANVLADHLALPPVTSRELSALEWYTRLDFTVVHGLASLVHPNLRRFPSVVTMHDLQHLHFPEHFSQADIRTREWEYRESCRLAAHIICVSEFTRMDVHRQYGVPLEKMTTIWNLPPRWSGAAMSPATIQRLTAGMGVRAPFLFYPAQPWTHKNHRGLLEALQLADRSLPAEYKLVLTGQPLGNDHPAAALLSDPRIRGRVMHLGYRTPVELAALYRTAHALVFPSLFEGFGLPLVEAMQQNCPIVCGRHTSIPEIVGDAALYTDSTSPAALAEAMVTIARDSSLREQLKKKGAENFRRFDRRALAEKTRAIYASIHDQHFA